MPILRYPPVYCGLESFFATHPMTSGALPSNRIALGDWSVVKPILFFCQFTAAQVLSNPSSYSNGCSPFVIGLRNTSALSVILFQISDTPPPPPPPPHRCLSNLYMNYERMYDKPQQAGGQRKLADRQYKSSDGFVNLQKRSSSHLQQVLFLPVPLKFKNKIRIKHI